MRRLRFASDRLWATLDLATAQSEPPVEPCLRAVEEAAPPTSLSAPSAEVLTEYQVKGLSGVVIEAMVAVARRRGLRPLVAPVRPSRKDRYPLTPIDRYSQWRREDGLPFDPGFVSTSGSEEHSFDQSRCPWSSQRRCGNGRSGSGCSYPRTVSMCSLVASHRCL